MKRIICLVIILIFLISFCSACKKAETSSTEITSDEVVNATPIEDTGDKSVIEEVSEEPSREPTYYPGVGEITPDILEEINEDKVVYEDGYENDIVRQYGLSEESEKIILDFCEQNISGEGESVSEKTYVYPIKPLQVRFVANHDHGQDRDTKANRWMQNFLDAFPTEAIRKNDDGSYCTIYDTVENIRLFVWYAKMDKGVYEHLGYVIYMAETLSYSDFAGIDIGNDAEKVEMIDPKVVGVHLRFDKTYRSVEQTQTAIKNGYPPRSLHLLTDGLLVITYDRDETGFYITNIEFHEDFTIDTIGGPQCCKIDPLDYVTQG